MNIKDSYLGKLKLMKALCEKYGLDEVIGNGIVKLANEIEDFKVKVPFVGRFNAGKSALINKLFSTDILPEEQNPETCIATEIKYGKERLVAHYLDGTNKVYGINDLKSIDAAKCKYVELFMENPVLNRIDRDVVIVDMPGFDSGIDAHNKAIMNYISQGTVFMIVVDSEDGAIKSSTLNFLNEIDLYRLNFSVLLNKCDKKMDDESDVIIDSIKASLKRLYNEDIRIEKTSIHFKDTSDRILDVINSIDKNALLVKFFETRIKNTGVTILKSLSTMSASSQVDTSEIENRIKELEKSLAQLQSKLAKERKNLAHSLQNNIKNEIVSDLRNAMIRNSYNLARSAMAGGNNFSSAVNDIVRPVLVSSTERHIEVSFENFLKGFEMDMVDIDQIVSGVKNSIDQVKPTLDNIKKGAEVLKTMGDFNKYYKVITTGLAVVTTAVAPWVELIIIFLPDILRLLGVGSEEGQLEKLKNRIENQIISDIIEKLKPEISTTLSELESGFVKSLEEKFEENITTLSLALENAKKLKLEEEGKQASYIKELDSDILKLSSIIKEMA